MISFRVLQAAMVTIAAFASAAASFGASSATIDWSTSLAGPTQLALPARNCQMVTTDGHYVFAGSNYIMSLNASLAVRWRVEPSELTGTPQICLAGTSGFFIGLSTPSGTLLQRRDTDGSKLWEVPLLFIARTAHLDSAGSIYLTDGRNRYAKLSTSGSLLYNVNVPPGSFPAVTVDRQNNKLVLVSSDNRFYVVNDQGVAEWRFTVTPTFLGAGTLLGIAANADSVVMMGATVAGAVVPSLYEIVSFSPTGAIQFRRTVGRNSFAMSQDNDGSLAVFFGTATGSVWERLSPSGAVLASVPTPQMFPSALSASDVMGRSGDIVATKSLSSPNYLLQRISSSGTYSEVAVPRTFFQPAFREGFGFFALSDPGAIGSFADNLSLRSDAIGVTAPGNGSIVLGVVSISPDGNSFAPTRNVSTPNMIFRVSPKGSATSKQLAFDRPRALQTNQLVSANGTQLDVFDDDVNYLFSVPTANGAGLFARSSSSGRALNGIGSVAVGVYLEWENEDGDIVGRVCSVVNVAATQLSSQRRQEPCATADNPRFRLLGGTLDAYYVLLDQKLRARDTAGGFLWETEAGRDIGEPSFLGADDALASDASAIYFHTLGQSTGLDIQKHRRDNGIREWRTALPSPATGSQFAVAGPLLLGSQLASVVRSTPATDLIFTSPLTGSQTGLVAIDPSFRVAFARKIPNRNELILGGTSFAAAGSDWRLMRVSNAGAVLNDEFISRPGEDEVLQGEVLADGSIILVGQAFNGLDAFGLASRVRLTPRATQTSIISLSPSTGEFGLPVTITASVLADEPEGTIRIDGRRGQFCLISAAQGSCVIEPSTAGPYRLTASYSGDRFNAPSTSSSSFVSVSGVSDLAIRFEALPRSTQQNGTFSYDVVVRNDGPQRTAGIVVSHAPPVGIAVSTWTCLPTTESFCGEQLNGTGELNAAPLVNTGDEIRYRFTATDLALSPETYTFAASVAAPSSVVDSNDANNQAAVLVNRVVFANGFE